MQDTDTHFNSRDGTGRFNWRFVWPVTVPAQYPSLKLQIFNSYVVQVGEPIGECNVDLSYDFSAARNLKGSDHRIPIHWQKCTHPGYPNKVSIYTHGPPQKKKKS